MSGGGQVQRSLQPCPSPYDNQRRAGYDADGDVTGGHWAGREAYEHKHNASQTAGSQQDFI